MQKPNNTQSLAYKDMVRTNLDKMISEWGKPTESQQIYIRNMQSQLKTKK